MFCFNNAIEYLKLVSLSKTRTVFKFLHYQVTLRFLKTADPLKSTLKQSNVVTLTNLGRRGRSHAQTHKKQTVNKLQISTSLGNKSDVDKVSILAFGNFIKIAR